MFTFDNYVTLPLKILEDILFFHSLYILEPKCILSRKKKKRKGGTGRVQGKGERKNMLFTGKDPFKGFHH